MKNKKTAFYILITYIIMQLSGAVLLQQLYTFYKGQHPTWTHDKLALHTQGWYMFFSMFLALIVSILFIARDKQFFDNFKEKMPLPQAILWGIIGFVMVLAGQMIGGMIESLLGISGSSENTTSLLGITDVVPIAILAIALFGPILEELVFRRVIFGSLYQGTSFWIAALISSLFFALMHFDFVHILLYAITGFVMAFLYTKTGRIITPMIAHILLNTFVTFTQ